MSITALKNLIVVMVGTGAHRTLKKVKLPSVPSFAETVLMKQIRWSEKIQKTRWYVM